MQYATKKCHYPKQFGHPLSLELNFTNAPEKGMELIVLGEREPLVAVEKISAIVGNIQKNNISLP